MNELVATAPIAQRHLLALSEGNRGQISNFSTAIFQSLRKNLKFEASYVNHYFRWSHLAGILRS